MSDRGVGVGVRTKEGGMVGKVDAGRGRKEEEMWSGLVGRDL